MFLNTSLLFLCLVSPLLTKEHRKSAPQCAAESWNSYAGRIRVEHKVTCCVPIIAQYRRYPPVKTDHTLAFLLTLTLMHDTELNPGPQSKVKYPCGDCQKAVTWKQRGVCCDGCDTWYHTVCQGINTRVYEQLNSSEVSWECLRCGMPNFSSALFNSTTSVNHTSLDGAEDLSFASMSSPGAPLEMSSPIPRQERQRKSSKRNLKVLNVNCRSVRDKHGEFQNIVDSSEADIIIATETWLTPDQADGEIGMPGRFCRDYKIHRRDREGTTKGGGVFVAVRNCPELTSTRQTELETDCEIVWVRVDVKGVKSLFVAGFYRPHAHDRESAQQLRDSINRITNRTKSHIWIAGDFNYPGIDWERNDIKASCPHPALHTDFLNLLDETSLTQVVKTATRDNNTLDLFLTSNSTLVNRVQIIPGISDHDAVLVESSLARGRIQQTQREIPLWKKADWPNIRSYIDTAWKAVPEEAIESWSENTLWVWFRDTLDEGIKKFVPHRPATKKDHHPWMSRGLKRIIKKSRKLYSRKRHYPSKQNINRYKQSQAQIQKKDTQGILVVY